MTTAEQIQREIKRYSFRYQNERALQDGVEAVLKSLPVAYEREHALSPKDRVDFFVDGVAIEIKVDGSLGAVQSQLFRYADFPQVKEIVLVTTRLKHQFGSTINGKPLYTAYLGDQAF